MHTRARTPSTRTHTQPLATLQQSKHSLGCGPTTGCRHPPTFDVAMAYRARTFSLQLPREASARRRDRSRTRTLFPEIVGAPRWPEASAWASPAPAAREREDAGHASTSRARGTLTTREIRGRECLGTVE